LEKEIILQNQKITYALRQSKRARRLRLAVYCDGRVVVTTPFDFSENAVQRFLQGKINWLISKIDYFKKFKYINIGRHSRQDYLTYKEKALSFVQESVAYFSQTYGFEYKKINIKRQKTRWGSCSKKGNLNFNYKIIFLPENIRDYIVVHELCHLKELNHSKKFWDLVAKIIPDYREIRKELKKNILVL
jgi:predicted metal-dependent hydrolase